MNSNTNTFKESLKANIPNTKEENSNNQDELTPLLKALDLFPLPQNVEASISDDKKYLNIKLKEAKNEQHISYQFPIEPLDLSALESRDDYQELSDRYSIYTNDYVDEIKKYAIMERAYLQNKFPGLIFNIKIRLKSRESYLKKLNQNILDGKSPYINDIMAERIIVSKYNGSEDEDLLVSMCYKVAKAIYDFRINTNFRMKKELADNTAPTDKEYISKDYIAKPKPSGYKSLHVLIENLNNPDLTYETQIRTFDMENLSKTSGEIAHNKYKPRILNDLSANRVPIYSEVSSFTDEFGKPILIDLGFDYRFYHFYNSTKNDHSDEKNLHTLPITYKRFRDEQYQLEDSLGLKFKDLRKKLKDLSLKNKQEHPENNENQEVR